MVSEKSIKKTTIHAIQQRYGDTVQKYTWAFSETLYNKISEIINFQFKDFSRTIKKTRFTQAIYFIIAITSLNFERNKMLAEINADTTLDLATKEEQRNFVKEYFDTKIGCQLSKSILTSIISNKDLYQIKNLLLSYNIIKKVEFHAKKINGVLIPTYYSKNSKKAISYRLHDDYLNLYDFIDIQNRYADKHMYLKKHEMLFRK